VLEADCRKKEGACNKRKEVLDYAKIDGRGKKGGTYSGREEGSRQRGRGKSSTIRSQSR